MKLFTGTILCVAIAAPTISLAQGPARSGTRTRTTTSSPAAARTAPAAINSTARGASVTGKPTTTARGVDTHQNGAVSNQASDIVTETVGAETLPAAESALLRSQISTSDALVEINQNHAELLAIVEIVNGPAESELDNLIVNEATTWESPTSLETLNDMLSTSISVGHQMKAEGQQISVAEPVSKVMNDWNLANQARTACNLNNLVYATAP